MKSLTTKELSGMELSVIITLAGIWAKVTAVWSNIWGVALNVIGFILAYMLPVKELFVVLGIVVAFDFSLGMLAAIKSKAIISSSKMRGTLVKVALYGIVLGLAYTIEKQFGWDIATKVLFALAGAVELLSIIANALILKPDMPFLKLFLILVEGEIAKKLNIDKDKVKDILGKKETPSK